MLASKFLTKPLRRGPAHAVLAIAALLAAVLLYLFGALPAAAQTSNTFTVSDVTVVEGGSANITVTLSSAAPSGGVAFTAAPSYSTTGPGSAAATDVQSVAGALTIAQNATSGSLQVRAAKDTANEGAETFTVTVTVTTTGWSASSGDNAATVTIHDPVRFAPQTDAPSASRAGIGASPESSNIRLFFKVGEAVSVQFPAAHDGTGQAPYTYALGGPERFYKSAARRLLPGGLTFDPATRTLSGTPTGVDGDGVTTLGSWRVMSYHVWDDSGEGGPDGDDNTEDNHDELKVTINICPAGSAATADGATVCLKTAELYSLTISHGDPATRVVLNPIFHRDTATYSATVAETVTAVDVSVLPEDLNVEGVTMSVNEVEFETTVSSRTYTGEASLNTGANAIVVEITSNVSAAHEEDEEGVPIPAKKTYTVNLQRGTAAPAAPTGVSSTPGAGRLDLAWTAPSGAVTGYDVEYKLSTAADQAATTAGDPSTGWVDAGHSGTDASHAITGLTHFDTWYDVRVRAANGSGNGPWAFPAVWEAALTVKRLGATGKGCSVGANTRDCGVHLTDNDFTYNGVDFTVQQLADAFAATPPQIQFILNKPVGPLFPHAALYVGDASFLITDAVTATQWQTGDAALWASDFDWAIDDVIPVRLSNVTHTWPLPPVSFGDATIDDMHFTAGAEAPNYSSDDRVAERLALALPAVTGDAPVTYTATGLPAGLSLGIPDRVIYGTPEAATNGPVTVTYTAADEIGGSASLTFQVTVATPVVFKADELAAFNAAPRLIEYTIGQTARISETLPEAEGGYGDPTYHLTYVDDEHVERTINDDAPGFSFDSATRLLTSDTGGSAPSEEALYYFQYRAVDANGSTAIAGRFQEGRFLAGRYLAVRAAPSLPDIADQNLTVGVAASITLPDASGGSLQGLTSLDYTLSPEVEGLTFRTYDPVTLAWGREVLGTPVIPGSTEMTYTATDANGVSGSGTFTITVVNGPSAPSAAPSSLSAGHVTGSTAAARWNAVTGARAYVVQVIDADGSFPDKPLNSMPDNVALGFDGQYSTHAVFSGIRRGDYRVRVAARNDDGVGPWSTEVSFTVRAGGV